MAAPLVFAMLAGVQGFSSLQNTDAFLGNAHIAHHPEEEMGPNMNFAPLSTTMKCVIMLLTQYIVVYTALGICRSYCEMQGINQDRSAVQKALKSAAETMFFAPMACLLFLGFRMRVLQLTKGEGNPQSWARLCMEAVAYSIMTNTILALVVPFFAENEVELEKETGEIKMSSDKNPFSNNIMAVLFTILRYVTFLGLYVGFGGVVVGVYMFEPPAGVWTGPVPDVSPAVSCTVTLSMAFFLIYLLMAISRTYSQFTEGNLGRSTFEKVMSMAASTMDLAPMLCVLFLAVRMRALQMDPLHGNPQRWAQNCFYLCTYSVIVQTCVAIFVPLLLNGKVKRGNATGDIVIEEVDAMGGYLAKGLSALRFLMMLCTYSGALAVVCAAFTMEHPDGKEHTIPVSPMMQCVINLSFQYFFIYILLWIFITVEDFTSLNLEFVKDAVESAKSTVQFAPMICVLFIGCRMRALQISDNKGAPQGWAQDGMYLASWALLIQFLMCLMMPLFTGRSYHTDSLDGSSKATEAPISNPVGAWVVTICRYVALIALYVGIVLVVCGVFLMTPETATGRGSIPVLGDGTLPVDVIPGAPPAVSDVPGVKTGMKATGKVVGEGADVANDGTSAVEGVAGGATDAVGVTF